VRSRASAMKRMEQSWVADGSGGDVGVRKSGTIAGRTWISSWRGNLLARGDVSGRQKANVMAKTYREIATDEMLGTVEDAMREVLDCWTELPPPMQEAVDQFRDRLAAAIDSVAAPTCFDCALLARARCAASAWVCLAAPSSWMPDWLMVATSLRNASTA